MSAIVRIVSLYFVVVWVMNVVLFRMGFKKLLITPQDMYNATECNMFGAWILAFLHFLVNPLIYVIVFLLFITHYEKPEQNAGKDFDGDHVVKGCPKRQWCPGYDKRSESCTNNQPTTRCIDHLLEELKGREAFRSYDQPIVKLKKENDK